VAQPLSGADVGAVHVPGDAVRVGPAAPHARGTRARRRSIAAPLAGAGSGSGGSPETRSPGVSVPPSGTGGSGSAPPSERPSSDVRVGDMRSSGTVPSAVHPFGAANSLRLDVTDCPSADEIAQQQHQAVVIPCPDVTADNVVQSLLWWFARLPIPRVLVSDQGRHFTARVVAALRGMLGVDHKFSVQYASWTAGKIERRNKEALRALRVLCSDARLPPEFWPSLLPLAQFILNHSPSDSLRLDNLAPVTVMCGLAPSSPLMALWHPDLRELRDLRSQTPSVREHVDQLLEALVGYHDRVRAHWQAVPDRQPSNLAPSAPLRPLTLMWVTGCSILMWVLRIAPRYSLGGVVPRVSSIVFDTVDDSKSAYVIFDVPRL
jgi:hypothetical protein